VTSSSVATSIRDSHPDDLFIDAPMSGGVVGARAGTLTFMLGCPEAALDRATSVLSLMGKRVFRLGEQGAGLVGKLANNYLLAISNIATCEAMNMGTKLGLDAKTLAELINSSSGKCWSSEVNNPVPGISKGAPAERGYDGGFGVPLMKKDLRLAMRAAEEANIKMVMGERAKEVYDEVEKEEGLKDFAVVYKWLAQKS
jgi:3-hydroxyisobutyrate dehydrogenase-like beta-hydroxyacid dehydrogenase